MSNWPHRTSNFHILPGTRFCFNAKQIPSLVPANSSANVTGKNSDCPKFRFLKPLTDWMGLETLEPNLLVLHRNQTQNTVSPHRPLIPARLWSWDFYRPEDDCVSVFRIEALRHVHNAFWALAQPPLRIHRATLGAASAQPPLLLTGNSAVSQGTRMSFLPSAAKEFHSK